MVKGCKREEKRREMEKSGGGEKGWSGERWGEGEVERRLQQNLIVMSARSPRWTMSTAFARLKR